MDLLFCLPNLVAFTYMLQIFSIQLLKVDMLRKSTVYFLQPDASAYFLCVQSG